MSRNFSIKFADQIALLALILSVSACATQIYSWARGPRIRVIAPDSFLLYQQDTALGRMVRIAATVSSLNVAEPAYGTAAVREYAVLQLDDLKTLQQWNAFGSLTTEGGLPHAEPAEIATPQSLPGQSTSTKYVLFATLGKSCEPVQGWCDNRTVNLQSKELLSRAKLRSTLRFSVIVEDADGKRYAASCDEPINHRVLAAVQKFPDVPLFVRCRPDSA